MSEPVAVSEREGSSGIRLLPKLLKEWVVCVLFALGVITLQHFFGWPKLSSDADADALMRYHVGVIDSEKENYPFTLIAIDDATYALWNQPLITPRDKLAQILRFAVEGGAALVILDIELSRVQDGTPEKEFAVLDGGTRSCMNIAGETDREFCEALQRTAPTPIILPRTIASLPTPTNVEPRREIRPSFLDSAVGALPNELAANVHWASPLYTVDEDRVIRRWRLWDLDCENNHLKAIPSFEVLVLALLDQDPDAIRKLSTSMQDIARGDCVKSKPSNDHETPLTFYPLGRERPIDLSPSGPGERILYTIRWSSEQSRLYADEQGREQRPQVTVPGSVPRRKTDLFRTISARRITESSEAPDPSGLKGHIVVIGATHSEAPDRFETPLGPMPGPVIIVNAIHSLLHYGQLQGLGYWLTATIAIVVISIAVLAYYCLWVMLAIFVVPGLIFLITYVLNTTLVHQGVWTDTALPSLIYALFKNVHYYGLELSARATQQRRAGASWLMAGLRALLH